MGLKKRSKSFGDEESFLPPAEFETHTVQPIAQLLYSMRYNGGQILVK
jgi:hypothetical protein